MSLSTVVSARDEEQRSPLVSARDEEFLSTQGDLSAAQLQKSVRNKSRLSGKAKSFDSWSGIEIAQTPRLVDAEDDHEDIQV